MATKMIPFCSLCGNMMFVEDSIANKLKLICKICPTFYSVTKTITNRSYYKLKEIDDVLGGEEAWKNVDSTEVVCPRCSHGRAYFMQLQTRSADEPMTTFYKCCNYECSHNWRD